ncbi:MAG: hypothetical protein KatS3mg115_1071 [Candidatus Poribacteria bacterium]|nr:MAG: hypothetical protein KatS3mg115_1071 [Candidatus Poribacteria bacterium]
MTPVWEKRANALVLKLPRQALATDGYALEQAVRQSLDGEIQKVVLDLSETERLDAFVLQALIRLHGYLNVNRRVPVQVVNPSPLAERLLRLTGADRVFLSDGVG